MGGGLFRGEHGPLISSRSPLRLPSSPALRDAINRHVSACAPAGACPSFCNFR